MVGDAATGPPGNESARRLAHLAAAAAALGLVLSGATLQRLMDYLALLQRWNKVYNLTALRDPDEMLSHHLIDCLAALPALRRQVTGLTDRPVRLLVDNGRDMFGTGLVVHSLAVCDQYTIQGEEFSRAILEDRDPPVTLEDAVKNMAVIEAIFRSAKSGTWETLEL